MLHHLTINLIVTKIFPKSTNCEVYLDFNNNIFSISIENFTRIKCKLTETYSTLPLPSTEFLDEKKTNYTNR